MTTATPSAPASHGTLFRRAAMIPRILSALLLLYLTSSSWAQSLDLLIRNGSVLDGSGAPAKQVDIGIRGDRVVLIGKNLRQKASRVIDAHGLIVAPGFIDPHTHTLDDLSSKPGDQPQRCVSDARRDDRSDGQRRKQPGANWRCAAQVGAAGHRHQRRFVHRPGLQAQRGHGHVGCKAHTRANGFHEDVGGSGHEGRGDRHVHRPVLCAGQLFQHRGSDCPGQGRGCGWRHLRHPYAGREHV